MAIKHAFAADVANTFVEACLRAKSPDVALYGLTNARSNGLNGSRKAYYTLMENFLKESVEGGRAAKPDRAMELYSVMKKNQHAPSLRTGLILIDGFCKAGRGDLAQHIMAEFVLNKMGGAFDDDLVRRVATAAVEQVSKAEEERRKGTHTTTARPGDKTPAGETSE